jgi:hypothetical protein
VSTARGGEHGPAEPGLDHLIRALTADGFPHELAGRDAALAAFRAASREERRRPRFALPRELRMPTRLTTVAATLVAGIAGVTAAAYAQALPAPVQHIAYSVLAPFGVPNSQSSASPAPVGTKPGSAPGSAPGTGAPSAGSPSPSHPSPAPSVSPAKAGSALVLTVGRVQLPAGETDVISGWLTYRGQPEPGVRVRLLKQAAGAAGWQRVDSAVTGPRGRVRFGPVRITKNTAFRLAVSGGADSSQVSVTAIPRVQLWLVPGRATDRLVAVARFGAPGDTVVLQRLSGGTWQAITTQTLGPAHRTVFAVPIIAAGADYRAVLQATSVHGAGMSGLVRQARARSKIGAKSITPATPQPTATASATASPTGTAASPAPSASDSPTDQPTSTPTAVTATPDQGLWVAGAPRDGYPPRDDHEQEPREPRGTAGDKADD